MVNIVFSDAEQEKILAENGYVSEEVDVVYWVNSHIYSHGSNENDDSDLRTRKVKVAYRFGMRPPHFFHQPLEVIEDEYLYDNVIDKIVKNAILNLLI